MSRETKNKRAMNHPHDWRAWGGDIDEQGHATGSVYVYCNTKGCLAAERLSADAWNNYQASVKAAQADYKAKRAATRNPRALP